MEEKENKITMPEPPTGVSRGFLSKYWERNTPFTYLKGNELLKYHLKGAIRNITALPTSAFVSISTIAMSIFLLAGLLLILQNAASVLKEAGTTRYISAYLAEDLPEVVIKNITSELKNDSAVINVEFISKEKALDLFRADLGSQSSFLSGIEEKNPLPASIDINIRGEVPGEKVMEFIEQLKKKSGIVDVVFGGDWVEKAEKVVRIFQIFCVLSILVVLFIVTFLIANTIKLAVLLRRREIVIMNLVGASDAFIRTPFLLGGLVQGLLGTLVGLLTLRLGFLILEAQLKGSILLGTTLPELHFLSFWAYLGILLTGVFVGVGGSYYALFRVIK